MKTNLLFRNIVTICVSGAKDLTWQRNSIVNFHQYSNLKDGMIVQVGGCIWAGNL